jgi:hypothetical protein
VLQVGDGGRVADLDSSQNRQSERYWITNGADTSTVYGVVSFLFSCTT